MKFAAALLLAVANAGVIFNRDSCDYTKADACADPSSGLRKNPAYYTYELCMTTSGCYKNIDPNYNEDRLQNLSGSAEWCGIRFVEGSARYNVCVGKDSLQNLDQYYAH